MEEGQKRKAGPRSGHREVTCPVVTVGRGAKGQGGAGHGSRLQPAVRGHASAPSLCHLIGTLCTS